MPEFSSNPSEMGFEVAETKYRNKAIILRKKTIDYFKTHRAEDGDPNWIYFRMNPGLQPESPGAVTRFCHRQVAFILRHSGRRRTPPTLRFLTKDEYSDSSRSWFIVEDCMLGPDNTARYRHSIVDENDDPNDDRLKTPNFYFVEGRLRLSKFVSIPTPVIKVPNTARVFASDWHVGDRSYALSLCRQAFELTSDNFPIATSAEL